MTEHELTAEDYASVEHAGRTLHERGWRTVFSLNQMFDAWQQLIEQIEQGYDLGVDEYTNDLSCRDWLAQAWPLLTPRLRALRHPQLTALDTPLSGGNHRRRRSGGVVVSTGSRPRAGGGVGARGSWSASSPLIWASRRPSAATRRTGTA